MRRHARLSTRLNNYYIQLLNEVMHVGGGIAVIATLHNQIRLKHGNAGEKGFD